MPRPRKPPRLALRDEGGRRMWIIRDGDNYCRTGCPEDEVIAAEAKLRAYSVGRYRPRTPAETIGIGAVYYISVADSDTYPIKIGWTNGLVSSRLASMQTGNPNLLVCLGSEVGNRKLELKRHDQFRWSLFRGEWYERTSAVMEHVNSLPANTVFFDVDRRLSEEHAHFALSFPDTEHEQTGTELNEIA